MAIEITELKKRATMINDKVRMYLLPPLFNAAVRAGASIMNIYKKFRRLRYKPQRRQTPITLADRLAHKTIREYLGRTRIPILSEEGREMRYDERRNWELYWLVDPLDGPVEFIKGNNEFTVNIALMEKQRRMGAVIYVPYFEKMYVAGRDSGSYVKEHIAPDCPPPNTPTTRSSRAGGSCPLEEGAGASPRLRVAVVAGRHQTPETAEHIARLREAHPDLEIVRAGEFLQILPAGRGEGRLLCPHDAYVRVGHCRGRADPRRSGRPHPHAARRTGNCSTTRRTCAIRGSSAGRKHCKI